MRRIETELAGSLKKTLPDTYMLLQGSTLSVHDAVRFVVLTGSRGPKGGFRPDSDIDISMLIDTCMLQSTKNPGELMYEVINDTISTWTSIVEIDIAVVYDKLQYGLRCFQITSIKSLKCKLIKPDCFGVYKTQKGFNGFVPDIGLSIEKVYPMLQIWALKQ